MNPFLKRLEKTSAHGNKSEKRVAKKVGANLTPGSGAMLGAKGDSVLPDFLIESKSTVKDSLSLKIDWLHKITREALDKNRQPALSVSFVYGSGESRPDGDWVLVPLHVFKEMQK